MENRKNVSRVLAHGEKQVWSITEVQSRSIDRPIDRPKIKLLIRTVCGEREEEAPNLILSTRSECLCVLGSQLDSQRQQQMAESTMWSCRHRGHVSVLKACCSLGQWTHPPHLPEEQKCATCNESEPKGQLTLCGQPHQELPDVIRRLSGSNDLHILLRNIVRDEQVSE